MPSRLSCYEAFFLRGADEVLEPDPRDPGSPYVYRFPPVKVGPLKRFLVQLSDVCVYITDGMSLREMPVPPEEREHCPTRIELMACTLGSVVGAEDGRDRVMPLLSLMDRTMRAEGMFFGPGFTLDVGERICPNSEMTGFFFSLPDHVDMERLCRCTQGAQLVLSVVPITPAELRLARDSGSLDLIARFEQAGLPNLFNPFRPSVV